MSRAFTARPASSTATTPATPQHTPDPKLDVRCLCGKKTPRLTSRSEKNPGRHFYACHKGFNDPERCKYFKWEDDLLREKGLPTPPSTGAARTVASMNTRPPTTPSHNGMTGAGHTLGGSPAGSRPISSIPPPSRPGDGSAGPSRPAATRSASGDSIDDDLQDITPQQWDKVDAVALASSPISAKAGASGRDDTFGTSAGGKGSRTFLDKLKGRQVEEIEDTDDEQTYRPGGVKRERSSDDEIEEVHVVKSPRKTPGSKHNPSQWEEIRSDPNNPYHAHHAATFPPTPTTPDRHDRKALGATTSMTEMSATSRSSGRGSDAAGYAGHAILGGVASHISMLERQTTSQEDRIQDLEDQLKKQSRLLQAKTKTEEFLRNRLHAAESRVRELQGVLDAQSQT